MDKTPKKQTRGEESIFVRKKLHFWIAANLGLVILAALLAFLAYKIFNGQPIKPDIRLSNQSTVVDDSTRRVLDGVKVEVGQENPYPVSIMIDNSPEARPQAGLASANLVIEAEAEGGITRYLAIFNATDLPDQVGPVRSARPYFIDWANEFSAVYTHCGGSPEALVKITRDGIIDLNEFYKSDLFWRSKTEVAPHNIYTSKELLTPYLESKGLNTGRFFGWQFKDDKPLVDRGEEQEIKINYQIRDLKVAWEYNRDSNNYTRFLAGREHFDAQGNLITAKDVIIQTIPAEEIDAELRLRMEVVGEGEAKICQDGKCQAGTWKKKNASARTRFYQEDGKEFEFNAGTIWIEVVRPEIEIEF